MIQNSIYVIMLPKYFICVGYGHELIYVVAGDKIVLECISLHHDTHLPTLMCWQTAGFDDILCVGNCISF